jgi:hypothetical protein
MFSPANGLPNELAYAVILAFKFFHKREISPSNFGSITKPILECLRGEEMRKFWMGEVMLHELAYSSVVSGEGEARP